MVLKLFIKVKYIHFTVDVQEFINFLLSLAFNIWNILFPRFLVKKFLIIINSDNIAIFIQFVFALVNVDFKSLNGVHSINL